MIGSSDLYGCGRLEESIRALAQLKGDARETHSLETAIGHPVLVGHGLRHRNHDALGRLPWLDAAELGSAPDSERAHQALQ